MSDFQSLHDSFDDDTSDYLSFKKLQDEKPLKILLVEDDEILAKAIKMYLQKSLYCQVIHYKGPMSCLDGVNQSNFSNPFVLITDISFEEGIDGLMLIDFLKERDFNFASICMTGFASIETAINATKKGVFHYLTKPFQMADLKELVISSCKKCLGLSEEYCDKLASNTDIPQSNHKALANQKHTYKLELPNDEDIFMGMIGRSPKMKQVFERIKKIADSGSTVLVQGASGTGKELVAKAIHNLSVRKNNKLVSVNCGAIPSELLESELFGHIKGAFTGAISDRKGRFEVAHQGTLFLDEIGDLPLLLQVKLLRALQAKQIEPVGSSKSISVDVRIITASHKDLEKQVEAGDFREDLFYRLNVIPIKIPGLSERKEDIPLLIAHFIKKFASADGRNSIELHAQALDALIKYDWPGNVRELENLIERLVILRGGHLVKLTDLPSKIINDKRILSSTKDHLIELPNDGIDLKELLSDIEDSLIKQALDRTTGNKNQASKLLSLNRTTLIEKIKKKGLPYLEERPLVN